MQGKIEKGDADVDIVEYSLATKMLESKLAILHALNINVDSEDGKISLNIKGSNKAIHIDVAKLKEAITVVDTQVDEKVGSLEEKKGTELESINLENITEEEFMTKAVEKIGNV